mmetsp:Transcript_55347/g.131455  ORF Transcript_55347/g.131455 Transcript_55347/m.131455 type:complete len:108 (+) Transcript_55347:39-362(+)
MPIIIPVLKALHTVTKKYAGAGKSGASKPPQVKKSKVPGDNGKRTHKTGWGLFIATEGMKMNKTLGPASTHAECAKRVGAAWRALGPSGQKTFQDNADEINRGGGKK